MPVVDFSPENFDIGKVRKAATRDIENKAVEITQNNLDTFLKDAPTKPKVLFFTDKEKAVPLTVRALSKNF